MNKEITKKIDTNLLIKILTTMLGTKITEADYKTTQLYGGTLGDVKLIEGNAKSDDGEFYSYKVVLKTQGKWERYKDADSWRREYDLYKSDLGKLFSESFRWAECYYYKKMI